MYYNPSPPQQESTMNLLISPFEPDQLQYALDNSNNNSEFDYNNATQPLDVPMQQNNNHSVGMDTLFDAGMSPIAMTNNMSESASLYTQTPSPQLDMMNNFTNEFISRSPESSSSADSNLVSPPQQYYPSTTDYSEFTLSDSLMGTASQYDHHPAARRSASVPPHFHKFKSHHQDSMYNQFQVTPNHHHHQNQHPMTLPQSTKALPIQIQRVNQINAQSNRPVNVESHRRQLDEKLEKVNFDDITVAELKEMLRERGLSATGRKAELMNRLKEEGELLARRGGAAAVAAAAANANVNAQQQQQQQQQQSPMAMPLHRRVANLNLMDSPTQTKRQQRLYSPYSPPPSRHASISIAQSDNGHRLASSVPESHTPSYLDDQFMIKRKPSCLRKSIDNEEETQQREWTQSYSASPPASAYYPSVPNIEESTNEFASTTITNTDIWDDQTLQNFLNQI